LTGVTFLATASMGRTYTRKDASEATLPFADVLGIHGVEVFDYRIYLDVTPLFAPPAA
jgi:hypothetical protein